MNSPVIPPENPSSLPPAIQGVPTSARRSFWSWLFENSFAEEGEVQVDDSYDWLRMVPFLLIHVACLGVLWVGVSTIAVVTALVLYLVRMFAITAFYHRYFSHRAYRTSRPFQFLMAACACTAGQRGPLWWAGHHRWHHKHSDQDLDLHSPSFRGFLRSHVGWFLTKSAFATPRRYVVDWLRFPELRAINRLDWLPFVLLGVAVYGLGVLLEMYWPALGTSGPQMLVWGFFISTVVLYHATYTINSLAHRLGRRRFETGDDSRNNLALALITLGEGWHNNHHHYPASASQGFYWWEIDITFYLLKLMSWTGLVWDLKPVSQRALQRNLVQEPDPGSSS